MPMFYTPKPRQFHYQPRFYNPEKERWEALKQKYADERALREALESASEVETSSADNATQTCANDADLTYFQRRVREIDLAERQKQRGLTWKDLFRKREMPKFKYQPRFSGNTETDSPTPAAQGTGEHLAEFKRRNVKIKRRFDISDPNYMKPVPATRIMLYAFLAFLLIYWIIF